MPVRQETRDYRISPEQDRATTMKLCTVQPHMPDSITGSVRAITRWIELAAQSDADIVVFPEMMLTGYDHHLHDLFKDTRWHMQVEEALTELSGVVDVSGTSAFLGLPYPYGDGHLNALVLLKPGHQAVLAGARSHLAIGDRNRWGFVEPADRAPADFQGILFGSVFCAEAHNLDYTQGKGLERSDVILWPGVIGSDYNENWEIIRDWNTDLARKIASFYNIPVIQSNYISYASESSTQTGLESGRMLGGAIACDISGHVLDRASRTEEDIRSFDINRIDGAVVVTPTADHHSSESHAKTHSARVTSPTSTDCGTTTNLRKPRRPSRNCCPSQSVPVIAHTTPNFSHKLHGPIAFVVSSSKPTTSSMTLKH